MSRLTATAPPGGRRRTSNPGWPRGPPPVGASRRDFPTGCARRSPERSPGDGGSTPPTSTFNVLFELGREKRGATTPRTRPERLPGLTKTASSRAALKRRRTDLPRCRGAWMPRAVGDLDLAVGPALEDRGVEVVPHRRCSRAPSRPRSRPQRPKRCRTTLQGPPACPSRSSHPLLRR